MPNRNGEYLAEFFLENRLICLKIKKGEGNYGHTPILVMLNHCKINKKWINSILNCEASSSFEGVSSNHRIISTKICLSLHRNKKQTSEA